MNETIVNKKLNRGMDCDAVNMLCNGIDRAVIFIICIGRGSHRKARQAGGRIPKDRGRYETDYSVFPYRRIDTGGG